MTTRIGNGEENCSNNSWVITSICCTFAFQLTYSSVVVCVWKSFTRCSVNFCCYHLLCCSRNIIYVYLHMRLSKNGKQFLWASHFCLSSPWKCENLFTIFEMKMQNFGAHKFSLVFKFIGVLEKFFKQ